MTLLTHMKYFITCNIMCDKSTLGTSVHTASNNKVNRNT